MNVTIKLKLKQQIILLVSLALLIPMILITAISIYQIRSRANDDLEHYRIDEMVKLKQSLKHITDIGYGILKVQYNGMKDSLTSPSELEQYMVEKSLKDLSKIRFDKGEGYFWVTDNKVPYPTMIMHAEKANLQGSILSDVKYNVEKYEHRNIYQMRAEQCNKDGEAFVEYVMKKPGTSSGIANKISYSRLFAPLGWIISTGLYTDQIELSVMAKKAEMDTQIKQMILYILFVAFVILLLGLLASLHFSKQLTEAILLIRDKLKGLSLGLSVEKVVVIRHDEVGEMTESLNATVDGLGTYALFAKEIGEGNLTAAFTPLSEHDILGNELLSMRDNLRKANEEKGVREWFNEGIAKLGEILRRNTNTTELGDEILKSIVRYLKANQGALFVMNEEAGKQFLQLVATYAYDKKKYIDKRLNAGEGLAGQCVLERATIHLREVPKEYIRITSGLGEALPRTLIITPLIYNDIVYGVIELASFHTFEGHEIDFIEKVAENLAATLSAVQVNERTRALLEQSRQMSEELKTQEEELRQNQEELQATQEQMRRRQFELEEENKMLKERLQAHL